MKTIFYGVNGEGLGHVSRTLAVVESLPDCEVHIFTFGKALDFLMDMNYPFVHEIKGMMFKYSKGRVSYIKSGLGASWYFGTQMAKNVDQIKNLAQTLRPSLYITDYEPSIARVAKTGTLLTIDNQHRFVYCDLSELTWSYRAYAGMVAMWNKNLVPQPDHIVISTFHYDRIKRTFNNVYLVEGLVRKAVEETPVTNAGHITVYLRDSVSDTVLRVLSPIQREFHVYGASETDVKKECEATGNFRFLPLSPAFVKDVASSDRLIGTAGHQLLTEARFFGKSMLAIPEPMQYEQYINAFYAEKTGFAESCHAADLSTETVDAFFNKTLTHSSVPNGVHKVKDIIQSLI